MWEPHPYIHRHWHTYIHAFVRSFKKNAQGRYSTASKRSEPFSNVFERSDIVLLQNVQNRFQTSLNVQNRFQTPLNVQNRFQTHLNVQASVNGSNPFANACERQFDYQRLCLRVFVSASLCPVCGPDLNINCFNIHMHTHIPACVHKHQSSS
jgi:hypothetical protein